MERFAILSACITVLISPILAGSQQSYGAPSSSFSSFGSQNSNNFNRNQNQAAGEYQSFRNGISSTSNGNDGSNIVGPKTFRHISLFIAPQEPDDQPRVRTIRPQQGPPDKHVQIIFVKAPSKSSSQTTEVELPPQPEQKTLVYVLLKQGAKNSNNVKIRGPAPTKPPSPQVYFIRYKDGKASGNNVGSSFSNGDSSFNNGDSSFNNGDSSFNNGDSSFNNGDSSFNNGGVTGGAVPVRSSSGLSTSYGVP